VHVNLGDELRALDRLAPVLVALPGPAYLVGGTVRDLLLGRPPRFDFDLAVVGDAELFARDLAERLAGSVTTHDRFGTATVHYDAAHVDLATARTESYAAPGALPDVAAATSIEADLRRRDFTINAMAVALPGGELIDPFNGEEHLRHELVRVLHERSFDDDPTRIFRAARYEARLGFRMDPKTETLALHAVPRVRELSGARVREELYAIFAEEQAENALARLEVLGVGEALGARLVPRPGLLARLRALSERFGLGLPEWHLGLLAVDVPTATLAELKVQGRVAGSVASAHSEAAVLRDRLAAARTSAEIVDEAERVGPDTPLYALALADEPKLEEYFERLRAVRLEVDGDDLASLGLDESPRVGEVLAELRRQKLNGKLDGRAEELAAARELIAE
jgi:tRNA nucleotidyltransferase (CCA-adding enzyme)